MSVELTLKNHCVATRQSIWNKPSPKTHAMLSTLKNLLWNILRHSLSWRSNTISVTREKERPMHAELRTACGTQNNDILYISQQHGGSQHIPSWSTCHTIHSFPVNSRHILSHSLIYRTHHQCTTCSQVKRERRERRTRNAMKILLPKYLSG